MDEKERKNNKINYERILLQMQIMEDKKITRAKKYSGGYKNLNSSHNKRHG